MAVLLAPIPFIFYRYGEPIRKRSKFAPTPDPKEEAMQRETSEENVNVDDVLDHDDEGAVSRREANEEV